MARRSKTARLARWQKSAAFRAVARKSAKANLRKLQAAPRCGAARKRDGKPCEKPAMQNGRCDIHGGKTPRGDRQWHVVQWPDSSTPEGQAKLNRKLRARARIDTKRAARLAAMTPEQRAAHQAWHRARRPGLTKAARRAERDRARQNEEACRLFAQASSQPAAASPEAVRLRAALNAAKAELARLEARTKPSDDNDGVFA
ncbi:HGGxSTG domain-containing protein [Bradyrhizobium brasilense]|uniref:HGGxSTG domain-containing protein n=1 Tax=Bradyrhizobium brasilense TaxID=1419277 RepID=UPI0035C699A9